MNERSQLISDDIDGSSYVHGRDSARRFLRIFAWIVSAAALLVASINLVAYRYMLREDNQAIVQLLSGWGRIYKPILYDEFSPAVAIFGASWARDAFDPIETSRLLGLKVFNHAVSGGTAYETRRFADSSVDNAGLKVAIINIDSFYRDELVVRARYGFDESLLDVDPEHRPNRWVGVRRAYSLTLAGWAIGTNIELVSAVLARDGGAARPDYLRSYERGDLTLRHQKMEAARRRVLPDGDAARPFVPDTTPQLRADASAELELMVDGFCDHGVDVYAYFTPTHVWQHTCDPQARAELATLEFLRRKQAGCDSKIRYFDFDYPNAVTLEGMLEPVTSSEYFRPDGHPQPNVGLLMAARMFGSEFPPATPAALQDDFGVDLLARQDAEAWLLKRAARCRGEWGEEGYPAYAAALAAR